MKEDPIYGPLDMMKRTRTELVAELREAANKIEHLPLTKALAHKLEQRVHELTMAIERSEG